MESGRSPKTKEDDSAFRSKIEAYCGKGNSLKDSRDQKENLEENTGSALGSSTYDKTEDVLSTSLLYKNEKIPNGCKVNALGNSNPKISKETCLETKVGLLQNFNISDETALETKGNSPGISSPIVLVKRASEGKTSLTRISNLEVPHENSLEIEIDSLRISNSVNPDENASDYNDLPQLSNLMVPGKGASKSSYLSTGNLFCENIPGNSRSLSSVEAGFLFDLPGNFPRNRTRKQISTVRKQKHQLHRQNSKDKGYDFQAVSQSLCGRNPFDWKLSSFETSGSTDNLTRMSSPMVPDVSAIKGEENLLRKCKPEVVDDSSLDDSLNYPPSSSVNSDEHILENKAGLPRISIPMVPSGDSLKSAHKVKIGTCKESAIRNNSSRENESLFEPPEASATKSTEKRKKKLKKKKHHSHHKVRVNRGRNRGVSATKTLKIQNEKKNKSPGIRRYLAGDKVPSETTVGAPGINGFQALAKDTSKDQGIFSFDCLSSISKSSENFLRSIDTTKPEKGDRKTKESKLPPEASLGDHLNDLSQASTSAKLDAIAKSLQIEPDTNHYDNSRKISLPYVRDCSVQPNRNSRDSRSNRHNQLTHLSTVSINARNQPNASNSRQPFSFDSGSKKVSFRDCPEYQPNWDSRRNRTNHRLSVNRNRSNASNRRQPISFPVLKNQSQTKSFVEYLPWTNDENTGVQNGNMLDTSKTDTRETSKSPSQSDSRKIDISETKYDNSSEWWTLFSVDYEESSEIWDVLRAVFLQLLVFTASECIYNSFNFIFFLLLTFIAMLCILSSLGIIFYSGPYYSL